MKAIGVKNLRSFRDKAVLELKPINILLGKNSSGKSSFLRLFPLFKQTIDENTQGPILFNGKMVDYGRFDVALNNNEQSTKEITFFFETEILRPNERQIFSRKSKQEAFKMNVKIELTISKKNEYQNFTKKVNIYIDGYEKEITIEYEKATDSQDIKLKTISLDNEAIELKNYIIEVTDKSRRIPAISIINFERNQPNQPLIQAFKRYKHHRNNENDIPYYLRHVTFSYGEELKKRIKALPLGTTWATNIERLAIASADFKEIEKICTLLWMQELTDILERQLRYEFYNIHYIKPIRATAQRDYEVRDIAVDRIDPHGNNLAMFILNLNSMERNNYEQWLIDNFGYKLVVEEVGSHIELKIQFKNKEEKFNMADMGFGFSQVLPIITQLWQIASKQEDEIIFPISYKGDIILAIEQPELHLHPAMQYELAKSLANISNTIQKNINLKIIIETHSEVFVNTIGIMIARQKLLKENVSVSIFEYDSEQNTTTIKKAAYDDDGGLNNWPYGFFKPDFDEM